MKDISEFEKLFKVNIPVQEHFEYYIDTLKKSAFYAGIGLVVKEFEQYELDVEAEGYSSARSYKLDYALPKLKEYLLNTNAYSKLQSAALDNSKLRTKDELRNNDDTYLISIDFKSANYSALKTFDDSGELFGSWEELCIALDIHPTLAKSKSFRQFVFGNTNPGRLQKVQHQNIVTIVDKLIENHGFEDSDFVFISHDEFIIKLRPDNVLAVNRINVLLSAIGTIIQNEGINMLTHYKVFMHKALGAGMCIQTQYQVKMTGLSEKCYLLFKVPGHKFFKYFKRYILQQPLDKRDLMFMSDGEIAVWSVDEDSVDEIIIPEGEMSMGEIESEYPYLIEKLKQEVPSMNNKQIRKAINVFLGLCNSCHNAESNCVCWRDE